MHTVSTLRRWMSVASEEGARAARVLWRVPHEKTFWEIMAILGILAVLLTLIILFGNQLPADNIGVPMYYGTYY